MKKWHMIVIAISLLSLPVVVAGQNIAVPPPTPHSAPGARVSAPMIPQNPPPGVLMWYPVFWRGNNRQLYSDEIWQYAASVSTGAQWMNMSFDFPFSAGDRFNFESMNLRMNTEPFWVGFAEVDIQPYQHWIFYGRMGANLPRDADMEMDGTGRALLPANPSDPALDSPPNLTPPWIWKARDFHWWLLEGGVVYSWSSTLALEAGIRLEHTDFRLEDPRNFTTPLAGAAGGNRVLIRGITCERI